MKLDSKTIQQILVIFAIWRTFLFALGQFAQQAVEYKPSFPYAFALLPKYQLPQWLYSWANFDGVHYLTIVEKGYLGTGLIQAFFPLYPMLVSAVNQLIGNTLLAGLLVSNLLALVCCYLLWYLVRLKFSSTIAWKTLIIFLIFPTSFYLGALYSESLFVALILLTFVFAHHKKWLFAGVTALLASATRVVGVFLVPALIMELLVTSNNFPRLEYLKENLTLYLEKVLRSLKDSSKNILSISLGVLGLGAYMFYLYKTFGDPLFFLHVQAEFGSGRQESIVLLPQVFWRAIKIMASVPFDFRWLIYLQELALTFFSFILIFLSFRKSYKIPISWSIFSLLAILLPTTTGTFSSMPRYVLVAVPMFVILAQLRLVKAAYILLYGALTIVLIYNTILFIQGYWVA